MARSVRHDEASAPTSRDAVPPSTGHGQDREVTVVILGYNSGPYLREAIESCLLDACVVRCVVVIDGGSKPESAEVARQVAAEHPGMLDVLELRVNVGTSAARNIGLEQVKTPWVALLDGDDRLRPGALDRMVDEISTHPGTGIVWGHYDLIDEVGNEAPPVFRSTEQGHHEVIRGGHAVRVPLDVEAVLTQFQVAPPSCWMLDVQIARKLGGFDPGLRQSKREDVEFVARILVSGFAIREIADVVTRRRVHPGQQSGHRAAIDMRMIPSRWRTLRRASWADRPAAARGLHGLFAMKHLRARSDGDRIRSSFWLMSRGGARVLSASELGVRVIAGRKELPVPVVGAPKSPPVR